MTDADPPLDVARIAFVTRRFYELQRLDTVIFGCGLVMAAVLGHGEDDAAPLAYVMMPMLACQSYAWPLGIWYIRTFGQTVVTPMAEFVAGFLTIGMMLGVFGDIFWQVTRRGGGPSFAAVALALYALSVLARDWRQRPYYGVALAAGVAGALVTVGAPGLSTLPARMPPARAESFLLAYTWVGLSLALVGLLDHRMLATTLTPRRRVPEPGPSRLMLSASNGGFRAGVAAVALLGSAASLSVTPDLTHVVVMAGLSLAFLSAAMLILAFRNRRSPAYPPRDVDDPRRARFERPVELIGGGSPVWWLTVAAASAADVWTLPHGRFLLLPLSLAAWSAWVAIRDWPTRRHYLIGALAVAAVPVLGVSMAPPRAFALLVLAVSASVVVEGLLDQRVFRRLKRHPDAGLAGSRQ